jgi:hypothetical protein
MRARESHSETCRQVHCAGCVVLRLHLRRDLRYNRDECERDARRCCAGAVLLCHQGRDGRVRARFVRRVRRVHR